MIAPSMLRRVGLFFFSLGLTAGLIGFLFRAKTEQDAISSIMTASLAQVQASSLQWQLANFAFWGGVSVAACGIVLWIVGYLKAPQGEVAIAEAGGARISEWTYRRIRGKGVYYRKLAPGTHEISVDGKQHSFDDFEKLEGFLEDYRRT